MKTKQAFEDMLSHRGWYVNIADMDRKKANNVKRNYAAGKVSLDKIEELLSAAGYKVKQEKEWVK